MKPANLSAVATAALIGLLIDVHPGACATMPPQESARKTEPCSQACLAKVMLEFKASLLARRPVELAEGAEVRENMEVMSVDKSAWKDVKAVKSSAVFADAVTGNVVSRDGVEMIDGKAAYISTRLTVEAGRITEVEFSSDVARANPAYVWNLPPVLTATVPEAERMTRAALDALAHRYFRGSPTSTTSAWSNPVSSTRRLRNAQVANRRRACGRADRCAGTLSLGGRAPASVAGPDGE